MTLLEGPVFGPDGGLYLVDVMAPAGGPKVMKLDVSSGSVETVYTDDASAFTSAQFSPYDGRLYLTDFVGGTVQSVTDAGKDHRTFFQGTPDGVAMNPDDIAFDRDGNLYVTDAAGSQDPYWKPTGRLVRIDRDTAEGNVLARDLPAPNGIAFTAAYDGLWVSHNTGNQIDYLSLSADGRKVQTAHPAVHVSAGVGQVDSLAVDAAGNTYVGLHNRAAVLVYRPDGELTATIAAPGKDGVSSATNIAIRPGTTEGYMTVSGKDGGFIYGFTALADGVRQSNGG
ncbi:SMP-30/gluconolactonase/LRE family protein [Pseudarthrobacter sp. lyk4-40-TYG-27]|uniref:SMP-30/gluconolactonase/LRE family protein n=1 Tax=Pseudarthrobacter sp. lyk4-40-TYG-27 TaxID=3040305 RepID=UPI0025552441|nr:SMP-30/gluconolactonase/LRE family protein [Pseudarthrobacter sp. lyk4-40-TYG-27]